jgi:hypothetical protein
MSFAGSERRKHPRINNRFIVSYRLLQKQDRVETSQTKNLSIGGLLLTTNRKFQPGTSLALEIHLPFDPYPITIIAKVLQCHEVTKDLIYDTRLAFIKIDKRHHKVIANTVNYYLKKG